MDEAVRGGEEGMRRRTDPTRGAPYFAFTPF